MPQLDKSRLNPELFRDMYEKREGLSKLLMYDYFTKNAGVPNRFQSLASK